MTSQSPSWVEACNAHMTPTDRRNMQSVGRWILSFGITLIATTLLLKQFGESLGLIGWLMAAVPSALGIGLIVSYRNFLAGADELLRKISVDALALGFGAGIVFMTGYRLMERIGAPQIDTSDPILVMITVWAIAHWIAVRRYA